MTDLELEQLVAIGHELRGVEFKGPGPLTDNHLFAKLMRAILGMSNRRDGGYVIIGVDEVNDRPTPAGLSDAELATWTYDDLMDKAASYADPFVELDREVVLSNGKAFMVIIVHEFRDVPVLCRKDYPDPLRPATPVLRQGACYVRSRRKPETSEIPSQTEMRELLELATEKQLRKLTRLFVHLLSMQSLPASQASQTDESRFDKQLKELL